MDPVQPHHVRQAAAEYDQLGQDEFLARHGFGRAQAYLLILDNKIRLQGHSRRGYAEVTHRLAEPAVHTQLGLARR
jgi:hypothetical protein